MTTLAELLKERAALIDAAKTIRDAAKAEERDLTEDEEKEIDEHLAGVDSLDPQIEKAKRALQVDTRIDDLDASLDDNSIVPVVRTLGPSPDDNRADPTDRRAAESRAFGAWLRRGMDGLTPEERAIANPRLGVLGAEQRALSTTVAAGGYTIPEGFSNQLETAMLAFGGMREAATVIQTTDGADLPWPTSDDTSNSGAILAEGSAAAEQDMTFGVVTLQAYMYTSKVVRVSKQLLQDSAFDLESWLAARLAERIFRATNAHFTTGTGTGQPNGVVTAATLGVTGATGESTSAAYSSLVDLVHSVDPAYRRNARWMFSDNTLAAIKKMQDSQNRPLWLPEMAGGTPPTILGYPYTINQDVADMAANANSILFGDFSKYIIRDTLGIQLGRSEDRYFEYLEVAFIAFSRHDGDLIDAGTNPIKYFKNSAT